MLKFIIIVSLVILHVVFSLSVLMFHMSPGQSSINSAVNIDILLIAWYVFIIKIGFQLKSLASFVSINTLRFYSSVQASFNNFFFSILLPTCTDRRIDLYTISFACTVQNCTVRRTHRIDVCAVEAAENIIIYI